MDSKTVRKHRNDVIQLSQLLAPASRVLVAPKIYGHLSRFLAQLANDTSVNPNSLGVSSSMEEIVSRIDRAYSPAATDK